MKAATAFVHTLTTIRCNRCSRTLCRTTRDAIQAGAVVAIKCSRCDFLTYMIGSSRSVSPFVADGDTKEP
jgi:phage FluMu protein Com